MNCPPALRLTLLVPAIGLAACTSSSTVRTSADTAIVQTSAAPICQGAGAARAAQKQAAIETIKAGYDRYVIIDAASANNVRVTQGPGSYHTTGVVNNGWFNGTTTYRPGPTMVSGHHEQAFAIKMLRETDPQAVYAISARETLGDNWEQLVKAGNIGTCT